jgi:phosphoribosylglycinamide formyltransferase 1
MKKIAIFASGSGSNAENIVNYFSVNKDINIELILSNKKDAFVLERAKNLKIKTFIFNREDFYSTDKILKTLQEKKIDYIVLAGFLWLVPSNILSAFENKVINIHPALLPKYGGKGMYGNNVHKAVVENQDRKTGITIHFVNKKYDEGNIIYQIECGVSENDTYETVAKKVLKLEHEFFPKIIEEVITK